MQGSCTYLTPEISGFDDSQMGHSVLSVKKSAPGQTVTFRRLAGCFFGWLLLSPFALVPSMETVALGETGAPPPFESEAQIAQRATAAWEHGDISRALEIMDPWIRDHPDSITLYRLRGDIFAASRRPQDAIVAYDKVLAMDPHAVDVRWAKRGVMIRTGKGEEALAELKRIAEIDTSNPLVHLELAKELRTLDFLEESLESYKRAVKLAPHLPGWRLAMARARFDVMDYKGAAQDVESVLQELPNGSPLELPAKSLLSTIHGNTRERGRRFERIYTPPEVSAENLKEWGLTRAEAWNHFSVGRYEEAEPIYRRLLELNPTDATAAYQLSVSLVEMKRCPEAVPIFKGLPNMGLGEEESADATFLMGQCLVEMEQWEEAYFSFRLLYDAAVEFERNNKGVEFPPGTRLLDKGKISQWLDRIRPHVPEITNAEPKEESPIAQSQVPIVMTPEELRRRAVEAFPPQKPLESRAALMGRDADFSWFRFVIPAAKVLRDDFPTGAHEFIPMNPNNSFPHTQREIYLVFGLVSSSYDAVSLSSQCFIETPDIEAEERPIVQDRVVMSMNDQSGFFLLSRPENGWEKGLYRCGLFEGDKTSAYAHVDEVRFRIVDTTGEHIRISQQ